MPIEGDSRSSIIANHLDVPPWRQRQMVFDAKLGYNPVRFTFPILPPLIIAMQFFDVSELVLEVFEHVYIAAPQQVHFQRCIRSPLESELQRLRLYTPLIRSITASVHSLNNSAALAFDAIVHGLTTNRPLLPNLNRLKLIHSYNPLLAHVSLLLHNRLQALVLPYFAARIESIVGAVIAASPPFLTLQFVDHPENMHQFVQSIDNFSTLRFLIIPLLDATGMRAIGSLPNLLTLGIIINNSLTESSISVFPFAFDHHLSLVKIMIQRSTLITNSTNGIVNNGYDSVRALLHALPIPCRRLAIWLPCDYGGAALAHFIASLVVDFESPSDGAFSLSDLHGISLRLIHCEPRITTPLPSNFLYPLSSPVITYIDMGDVCGCSLDDDALEAISSAIPNLETFLLGTKRYWTAPPRVTLAELSAVLRHCPALKKLGLVFNCSIGASQYVVPMNTAITTLLVGVSLPYNPNYVIYFLSRALPHLSKICIELYDDQESSDKTDIIT
ncbi:hypothetical protein DEU56DRAFT_916681 [Suillus clintonianus]|uniref:uncharacterized protein n=1 Tax=Suillus clintonianus TaxID=1904413 RepID=UPI001B866FEB|nr:uncharacterized protein DEU56DRAFT_916681 [Suillus clintonianus]KAG2125177.1 hypothetical protein DEU56DRAFT_916681 [Suillus clintonianus]